MKPEKLYRCPICGDIVTEEELELEMKFGGTGYCYCEFMETDPETGDVWFPRILHEYDVYHLSTPIAREENG